VGLSRGEYALRGAVLGLEISFARRELAGLVAGLDADHDGAVTREELDRGRESIQGAIVGRIRVKGDGAPCPGSLAGAELVEQDGALLRAEFRCAKRPSKLAIEIGFMDDLPFGHRHVAHAVTGAAPPDAGARPSVDAVLSQRSPSFEIPVAEGGEIDAPKAAPPGKFAYFVMGIEHILTGYDHPSSSSG
jgi:hypothetical protein